MPRTVHVEVTYSVHIEDDKMSDAKALIYAKQNFETEGNIFNVSASIFEKWKTTLKKLRKGRGSY